MEKSICFRCTSELWKYIKPYLEKWDYKVQDILDFSLNPYIILDYRGSFGTVTNLSSLITPTGRKVIKDVEEFLERAAKLKGFEYTKPWIINGVLIKPGMQIITKENGVEITWFIIPTKNGLAAINYEVFLAWEYMAIDTFIKKYINKITHIYDVIDSHSFDSLLWEKPKYVVYTKQEIADILGISVTDYERYKYCKCIKYLGELYKFIRKAITKNYK